jgi:uncharacterized protein YjiS (DUF1127 family)
MSPDIHRFSSFGPGQALDHAGAFLRLTTVVEGWIERHRQRRALLELSDHMLKDIGIGRADAWLEGRKPFWQD